MTTEQAILIILYMIEKVVLQPLEYAHLAVDVASDGFGADILLLDVSELSAFTDYFVILTAESSRQLDHLAEEIEHALERSGAIRHHREGTPQTGWMLLDFGDVVVHLFAPEFREFYNLEDVWSRASEVIRIL